MRNDWRVWAVLIVVLLLILALGGCGPRAVLPPKVQTVEVRVPVPVPCRALAELGPAPSYPDSDLALRLAANLFERVKLLLAGRALRDARLAQHVAAEQGC